MAEALRDDGATFVGDGYVLVNNTWGRRDLVNGEDYSQTINHDETIEGVTFVWDWPYAQPRHVLAYPSIYVGEKPWTEVGAEGELPLRLAEIDGLMATFDLDWGGDTQGFNVTFDLWLSSDPAGGRDAVTHEIMIWLKSPEFSPGGKVVDTISVPGLTASFRYKDATPGGWPEWIYAAFKSTTDLAEGAIDIDALLNHLVDEGLADPNLWLMDIELGAEIIGGAGWLRIDGFEIDLNTSLTRTRSVAETQVAILSPYATNLDF